MTMEPKHPDAVKTALGICWLTEENAIQAVLLRQRPEGIEFHGPQILFANTLSVDFLVRQLAPLSEGTETINLIAGLDSSHIGFYRFEIPAVPAAQQIAIIRTQAEGCLPLPASSMQLAWRIHPSSTENQCVLAAIRKDLYEQLCKRFPPSDLLAVVPDIVGLLVSWQAFFQPAGGPQESVLLQIRRHQAVAVLTEEGRLLNAAHIDIDSHVSEELLKADLIQMLESLSPQIRSRPIFLFENKENPFSLIEELRQEGLQIHPCLPVANKIKRLSNLSPDTVCACLEALGLALLALDGQTIDFDFTVEQTEPAPSFRQQFLSAPVRRTALSVLLAVAVMLFGLYWKDKTELRILQEQLSTAEKGQTAQQMLQMMELRKQVAAARPDLLELLDLLRQAQPEGILLDQFLFERGKPIELRATASSYEQAYEFQKKLQQRNECRQVQMIEPVLDEKTKKVNFRIRFLYRNFSG